MTTQRSPKNRLLPWDDEASADILVRRAQQVTRQGASPAGRNASAMPLGAADFEGDDEFASARRQRFDEPQRAPWWRPATKWGRIFLGCSVLTVTGMAVTAGYVFKTYLERDSRFRIDGTGNIETSGLSEITRADVLPVFGEDVGRNIFFVPLSQRRKQLEKIPWIEKATVMRVLPDQLRISVVERQPVAFVRHGQQIGLVDANGVLLSMSPSSMTRHHYSFPVVTGIDAGDPLPSRKARMAVYGRLISDLDSTGKHLSEQISEIDLTDPEDARVLMPEQGTDILAHFGDDQFLTRYQRYKAHIAEWRQQYPHLASVDLRYDQQVVLEMAPGTGGSQTTTDDGKPTANAPRHSANGALSKPSAGVRAEPSTKAVPHKAPAKPKAGKTGDKRHASSPQNRNTSLLITEGERQPQTGMEGVPPGKHENGIRQHPSGAEAHVLFGPFSARLKSCPVTRHAAQGVFPQPLKSCPVTKLRGSASPTPFSQQILRLRAASRRFAQDDKQNLFCTNTLTSTCFLHG